MWPSQKDERDNNDCKPKKQPLLWTIFHINLGFRILQEVKNE